MRVVLLKGAALATWLYHDGTVRPYGDVDLLVAPADHTKAEGVLVALGFGADLTGLAPAPLRGPARARVWMRGGAVVDLHRNLWGIGIDRTRAWPILLEGAKTVRLGGGRVEILGPAARALHVALHAAQHGRSHPKPVQDLERAVAQLPRETWEHAARLARRLEAHEAMAAGLRLVPQGADLAAALGLPTDVSLAVRVSAGSTTRGAGLLAEVLATPGSGAKLAAMVRLAVPGPAQVRVSLPFAGRSRAALVAGHVWLPLLRMARLPRAAWAVTRIDREGRRPGPPAPSRTASVEGAAGPIPPAARPPGPAPMATPR